jgi:hypothetical protein
LKKKQTLLKELKKELHFWQMHVRMDIKSVKSGKEKCKEIGREMRKIQQRDMREGTGI